MKEARYVLPAQQRINPEEIGPWVLLEARKDRLSLITPTPGAQAIILVFAIAMIVVPFAGGAALFVLLGIPDPLLYVLFTTLIGLALAAVLLILRPWTPEFLARHPDTTETLRVLEVWHGSRPETQELHVQADEKDFWIVIPGTRARVVDAVKLAGQVPVYVEGTLPKPR